MNDRSPKFTWKNFDGKIKLFTFSSDVNQQSRERDWNPYKSKLSAALFNGLDIVPFNTSAKIFMIDEFSDNTYIHLNDIVNSSSEIIFHKISEKYKKILQIFEDENKLFDLLYIDFKSQISVSQISDFHKILKKSGFIFIFLTSTQNEIRSFKELSNWWSEKTKNEKINIFQDMGIPLNDFDMKFMLDSNFEKFSKIWQDNITLNLSKNNTSFVKKQIALINNSESSSFQLIEEVNLLNFFDNTLLVFQKIE